MPNPKQSNKQGMIDAIRKVLDDNPQRGGMVMLTPKIMANPEELIALIKGGHLFVVHRNAMTNILRLMETPDDQASMERP